MKQVPAYVLSPALRPSSFFGRVHSRTICVRPLYIQREVPWRTCLQPRADATSPTPEDTAREEQEKAVERMRARLDGLFGVQDDDAAVAQTDEFDGKALRKTIRDRWGVQYDVQPQKRHGRVYVQIMWRYFEQQSFYMQEDEFACHCEAVAQLLQKWNAVDYFCDYVASIKKRPVVGITINIPIPGITAENANFE